MADQFRYRRCETNPVFAPVASATEISIGDLLWMNDSGQALPAQSQTDQGSTVINQDVFHDNFLGVAMQASASGDTAEVRVASEGEFEFDCDAATFKLGDLVGPAINGTNGKPENQKVAAVADPTLAIGRVAKHYATNTTKVLVRVKSTVMLGGPQKPSDSSSSSGA